MMLCARILSFGILVALTGAAGQAQSAYERTFPQSKATIEKTLKSMQGTLAGRLPVLDGFAKAVEHPLDQYRRGYYQATIEVTAAPSGGSVVHIATKVTAWYADPSGFHSGYQLLVSNGRLEADLLDQIGEQLASANSPTEARPEALASASTIAPASVAPPVKPVPAPPTAVSSTTPTSETAVSAPSPQFPDTNQTFSSSLSHGIAAEKSPKEQTPEEAAAEKSQSALEAEADSLEKLLKGMAHPNNLVAVKKSGTPVVSTPSLTAKPDFLANMHDEFELLDFNADWVHVRISGLSRGWIWRNSVEMPEGIPDTQAKSAAPLTPAADLFHISREEAAQFPGDWEPLRGKNVKIISVQKIDEAAKDAGPKDRLEYAKFLLEKNYGEISQKPQELQGVVVIFDAADGGMIAATAATLQQWRAGTLSDAALWHNCFFDPPETFDSGAASGSK